MAPLARRDAEPKGSVARTPPHSSAPPAERARPQVRRPRDRRGRPHARLTDAELWVDPDDVRRGRCELVEEASHLLHDAAQPPRTKGTVRVNLTARCSGWATRERGRPPPGRDALHRCACPAFRWYFAARLVNLLGTTMAPVALAFAVLDLSRLAPARSAGSSPPRASRWSSSSSLGGVIADRFDRATCLRITNIGAGLSQGAIAALVLTGNAELWHLICLAAVNGTLAAVSLPAMASVVPTLVPREQLQPANVLLSMQRATLAVVGPSVAGRARRHGRAGLGPGRRRRRPGSSRPRCCSASTSRPASSTAAAEPTSFVAELAEGWTVFTGYTWLWVIVLAFGLLNAIHAGAWFTLGPAVAKDTIGERGWGYVLSAEAIGRAGDDRRADPGARCAGRCWSGCSACRCSRSRCSSSAPTRCCRCSSSGAFAAGVGMEVFGLGWNLAMQENIDERLLSRAYSYDALGSFVAIPIGQLTFGPLAETFGAQHVIVVAAVVYAAIALSTLLSRSVRRLERVSPTSPPTPASR